MSKKEEQSTVPQLSNKQVKYLRGLGHSLSALVLIGKEGITDKLIKSAKTELLNHELIKAKVGTNSSVNKNEAAQILPQATNSTLVQFIGKTLLLYKPNPKRPKDKRIILPK